MCVDPVTALMVGGTITSAVGSVIKGNAEASAYNSKAAQYDSESDLEHRQANIEQMTSGYQQRRKIEQNQSMLATQQGGYAAAGLVTGSGSASDVAQDTAREQALDISAIQWNSKMKASNLDLQGAQASMNAASARSAADTAETTGWLNAATSVASAFSPTKKGNGSDFATRLGINNF